MLERQTSRFLAYKTLNPNLSVHPIYQTRGIPEYARTALTRLRLGSHRLKVETGRWMRIPFDERLCPCGSSVQTEVHVLLDCPLLDHIRGQTTLNFSSIDALMNSDDLGSLCNYALKIFEELNNRLN